MSKTTDIAIEEVRGRGQRFVSIVEFVCPDCGADNSTTVDLPEPDLTAENSSDMASECDVEIECGDCGFVLQGYAYVNVGHCNIECIDQPEISISAGSPHYTAPDDWDDYVLPDDPERIFNYTISELRGMLIQYGTKGGGSLINRMIFSQSIGALEAYLCDTLIHEVLSSKENLARVITADSSLSETKHCLSDVLKGESFVKELVETSLKNRLYHKLDKVAELYNKSLDVKIVPDRESFAKLKTAVGYRHDCVHRNGVDKSGKRLDILTDAYIFETLETVKNLAGHVRREIDRAKQIYDYGLF